MELKTGSEKESATLTQHKRIAAPRNCFSIVLAKSCSVHEASNSLWLLSRLVTAHNILSFVLPEYDQLCPLSFPSLLAVLSIGATLATKPCHAWISSPVQRSVVPPSNHLSTTTKGRFEWRQHMALVPLSVDDLEDLLVVGPPSGPQYATYWGRTKVRALY